VKLMYILLCLLVKGF